MQYKIKKGFITQKLDGKTVIFDGEESVLYTFNPTATYIFILLKRKTAEKVIIGKMMKKYGITQTLAENDFHDLVKNLLVKKIITQKIE